MSRWLAKVVHDWKVIDMNKVWCDCRLTDCFPDEHFMHTVIALENLADETDCIGR